jgi:hypothetical protein
MIMTRLIAVAGLAALMAACSASKRSDLGTGLNTVDRNYNKPASETFDAAVSVLKSYDIRVDTNRHDNMGGELEGRRSNGEKVTVKVAAIDANNSKASVRVDPGDSNMSTMIHEKMADKLGMGTAKSALLGGNTYEGWYDLDVKDAVSVAEKTASNLGWTVVNKDVKGDATVFDARTKESVPVRIKVDPSDDRRGRTRVTFIAGHGKTEQSKTLLSKMHDEFDRHAGPHVH